VSWLDDIAKLTHLVEQGGSRRGAQMIMLVDSHPDIIEFIISKMQNPRILRYLIENTNDEQIRQMAKEKLDFTTLTQTESDMYQIRIPEVENYTKEEMKAYNEKWQDIGDVRRWEEMGYGVKVYREIKAKDLWDLINICATYSAEPGIFFIDNANDKTNATAYG